MISFFQTDDFLSLTYPLPHTCRTCHTRQLSPKWTYWHSLIDTMNAGLSVVVALNTSHWTNIRVAGDLRRYDAYEMLVSWVCFFLQVYIHTRQGANCVFIRNTDRLGIYTQKSPGAVAHVFDTVNAATTLKHTELNLAATPRPGDTIRFDSLAFPYRFSAAAYIDTGGGISCENTVISLNISMVGLCFALLWYVFMRLSVISGCREIIYQGLFCV